MLRRIVGIKSFSNHRHFVRNIMTSPAAYTIEQPDVRVKQSKQSTRNSLYPENLKMKGWQINEYGDVDVLQFHDNVKLPIVKDPKEVLVKVHAASVNPIDIAMMNGYGSTLFNAFNCNNIPFPITLGRDFCGVVVRKGMNVRDNIQVGDKVWGVIPPHKTGSHAEYACVDESYLTHKPVNLNDADASSLLYAGVTAWSGLFPTGDLGDILGRRKFQNKTSAVRICVIGAAGGVGSIAVQIAKAENAEVVAVCSTDAIPTVEKLGANYIVDYTAKNSEEQLASYGPYDIVLDCAGKGQDYAKNTLCKYEQYITFSTPLMRNFDNHGLASGLVRNAFSLIESNLSSFSKRGALIKWAFFAPTPTAIEYLTKLTETNKLTPLVDSVFKFDQMSQAFKKVENGHLRGKVVINLQDDKS